MSLDLDRYGNGQPQARPLQRLMRAYGTARKRVLPVLKDAIPPMVAVAITIAGVRPPLKGMRDAEMAKLQSDFDEAYFRASAIPSAVLYRRLDLVCTTTQGLLKNPSLFQRLSLTTGFAGEGQLGLAAQSAGLIGQRPDGKSDLKCKPR